MSSGLVWFRRDLRLADNPAWSAATRAHDLVTALFLVDERLWPGAGVHRRNQLVAHLSALDDRLAATGGRLLVRRGDPSELVPELAAGHDAVYWNEDVTPYSAARDGGVSGRLGDRVHRYDGCFVQPPGAVTTKQGTTYEVFTPFYKSWRSLPWGAWEEPGMSEVSSDAGEGIPQAGDPLMAPGEEGAAKRLDAFLEMVDDYERLRDRPDRDATSHLSADLKFGTIDARRLRVAVGSDSEGRESFVRQLAWRDFYAHLLAAEPRLVREPMREQYAAIRWRDDELGFSAWKEGRTGYPVVDAGMRQLMTEGWMHNRVRLLTASFLVKDLLVDWRRGERWFREQLVDGDVAQNVGNWQWVAGTGADAAPYFRIFNPITQGKKFDPDGDYVRAYVPELRGIPDDRVHEPWSLDAATLAAAGVHLGQDYPGPIVDHAGARRRALEAYEAARA